MTLSQAEPLVYCHNASILLRPLMQQNLQAPEDTTSLHRSLKQARDRNDELSQQLQHAREQALDAQQAADAAEKRCAKAQATLNTTVTSHVRKVCRGLDNLSRSRLLQCIP
jgi:uncharacterized membrane protein